MSGRGGWGKRRSRVSLSVPVVASRFQVSLSHTHTRSTRSSHSFFLLPAPQLRHLPRARRGARRRSRSESHGRRGRESDKLELTGEPAARRGRVGGGRGEERSEGRRRRGGRGKRSRMGMDFSTLRKVITRYVSLCSATCWHSGLPHSLRCSLLLPQAASRSLGHSSGLGFTRGMEGRKREGM